MNQDKLRVDSIFLAAVDKSTAQERSAYLDDACGSDQELRERVERLLAAQPKVSSFLEAPAPALLGTVEEQAVSERPGTVIGPYKLLEQIGEGGFGVVFMAEQIQPMRRKVAFKVLKPGMDTRQVVARFEAERQALALMDHPNIAHVFDGGETQTGRPYFVMELVRGIPITEFCDQNCIPIRERLELFATVCQAVQHAHQKGIIHRDLKPSNVMVTMHDDKPVVKVIDFGIAKATGQQLTEKTLFTNFAQMIGTPLYMSPEQAGQSGLDVDTRSDIYALGVLLYELLTGTTPFDKERLSQAGYDEFRRIIREEEPPKPSTRISTLRQAATTLSTQRKSDPRRLSQLFRGELDWIVMKALEKDRNRRYETASAFAADVQRYLHDEAVQACPPSAWYRFRKFARRNRARLGVAGLILFLVVVLGASGGWLVGERAARQRDAEGKVIEALEAAEPGLREGNPSDPALVWAAQRVEAQLDSGVVGPKVRRRAEQVQRDVRMLTELDEIRLLQAESKEGAMFDSAGTEARYAAAFPKYGIDVAALEPSEAAARVRGSAIREALVAGLDAWMQLKPVHERDHLRAVADGADDSAWRRAFREAALATDAQKLKALAGQAEALAQTPAVLAWLGWVVRNAGLPDEAAAVLRQAQQRHPGDFWINYNLGHVLIFSSGALHGPGALGHAEERLHGAGALHAEEAVGYFRVAVGIRLGSAEARSILGLALFLKGDTDAAIAAYQQAIALDSKFAIGHRNLARALQRKGKVNEAIAEYREAIALNPKFAGAHSDLVNALVSKGGLDEAIAAAQKAVDIYAPLFAEHKQPDDGGHLANALLVVGHVNRRLGRPKEAEQSYRRALEIGQRVANQCPTAWWKAHFPPACYYHLGDLFLETQRDQEAEKAYRRAIDEYKKLMKAFDAGGPYIGELAHVVQNLEAILLRTGRPGEAGELFREAIQLKPDCAEAYTNLGIALHDMGKLSEAVDAHRRAIQLKPDLAEAHGNLGNALHDMGKLSEAVDAHRRAIQLKPDLANSYYGLGNALRDLGQPTEAMAEFRRAIEIKPNFAEAHTNLGNVLRRMGKLPEAVAEYRQAIKFKPQLVEAHHGLGTALGAMGKLPEAVEAHRRAIQLKPEFAGAHFSLGLALHDMGKRPEAVVEYRQAIQLKPDFPEAHYSLGNVFHSMGKLPEAVAEYHQAIKFKPQLAQAHHNLGIALRDMGKLAEAVDAHRRAIELKPDLAEAHCGLGVTLQRQGQFQEALAAVRRGHELGSRDPRWSYPLAQLLREAERLVELDAKLAGFLDGKAMPASAGERVELAYLCTLKALQRAAVRFYEEAFAAEPKLAGNRPSVNRYNAACAAALAGCGQGKDADKLDDTERARLRRQGLDWLRADLSAWDKHLEAKTHQARAAVRQQMQHWQQDIDFAGVRGTEALAKLPDTERREWQQLWDDVEALARRTADQKN